MVLRNNRQYSIHSHTVAEEYDFELERGLDQ
jgi:hypothetical protein